MKNKLPFAALTFAFTIAGASAGSFLSGEVCAIGVCVLAVVGGIAAALCGDTIG